ncbi:MAG: hypothetical protein ACT4P6_19380 [Gemmatimonadaceae bacterium]
MHGVPLVDGRECRDFNTYKYGLDELVPYMKRRSISAMLASFRQRDVFLLQGLEDRDPMHDGVDRECPALLQGNFRLERGKRYYEYLGHFVGTDVYTPKFIEFAGYRALWKPDVSVAPREGDHLRECGQRGRGATLRDANSAKRAASIVIAF